VKRKIPCLLYRYGLAGRGISESVAYYDPGSHISEPVESLALGDLTETHM